VRIYVIERDRRGQWTLSRFGQDRAMMSGPDLDFVLAEAFGRLSVLAPCTLRVLDRTRSIRT
jgi:hypothetical protein